MHLSSPHAKLLAGAPELSPPYAHDLEACSADRSRHLSTAESETFPDGFTAGTVDWGQFLYPNPGRLNSHDKTRLCMRTSGNLVLATSKGKVIWSSHTAGTGGPNS